MPRNDPVFGSRFPSWLLTISLSLTIIVCAGLSWQMMNASHLAEKTVTKYLKLERLRGDIVHLDEVLTMSSRLAALTGDLLWEQRYRDHEPALDANIRRALVLATDFGLGAAAQETNVANQILVAWETQAFDAVRQGDLVTAQSLVFSPEYGAQKQVYADGMASLMSQLANQIDFAILELDFRTRISIMIASVAIGVMIISWFVVARALRLWREALLRVNTERARLLAQLTQGNKELVSRVIRRTTDLESANARANEEVAQRALAHQLLQTRDGQLRSAQKMEMIGRMAVGVAHDYNNLLTAITGHNQFILDDLPRDHPLYADALAVQRSAERAALLTKQLTSYGQLQSKKTVELDVVSLINDLNQVLRRLVDQRIHLVFDVDQELGSVLADPGHLGQLIVNLVVNARDAVSDQGSITITARNLELDGDFIANHPPMHAGKYVMLAINDNGCGMDHETLQRMFEPFFTTKPIGKGIGLGLATVQDIVQQLGGYIGVESEPGNGTTVQVFLPRIDVLPAAAADQTSADDLTGSETVLLVDNDESVRELLSKILLQHGYTVLDACDGPEAIQRVHDFNGRVHLVITEMLIPNSSGQELVEQLRQSSRISDKALFMSGENLDLGLADFVLSDRAAFIKKPFSGLELLRTVRSLLDPHTNKPKSLGAAFPIGVTNSNAGPILVGASVPN